MSSDRPREVSEHEQIWDLLPWYVNGTIAECDRQRVDSHLDACADCRAELRVERRIHRSLSADSAIDHVPAASLKRLHTRLDESDDAHDPPLDAPAAEPQKYRSMPWRGWMAASTVAVAVTGSLLMANRWMQSHAAISPRSYHTVTTPTPRAKDEVIRAVFSPTITLEELQGILDDAQLRIVAGPSEAGVYSLATNSSRPVNLSLALLRQHAAVRFAETTQVTPGPGAPP